MSIGDDLRGDVLDGVGRNRESDSVGRAETRVDRRECRDTDHPAREIDERAAAVPGVDCGTGLDGVRKGDAAGLGYGAIDRAHDALGHAALQTERVADGQDDHPDLERAGVGEHRGLQRTGDPDDREITDRKRAHERCGLRLALRSRHLDRRRTCDDVIVGDNVAAAVEGDPGPEAGIGLDLDDRGSHRLNHSDVGILEVRAPWAPGDAAEVVGDGDGCVPATRRNRPPAAPPAGCRRSWRRERPPLGVRWTVAGKWQRPSVQALFRMRHDACSHGVSAPESSNSAFGPPLSTPP